MRGTLLTGFPESGGFIHSSKKREPRRRLSFEAGKMVPVYIEVPDGIRLLRAVKREENQKKPNYREVCRRYLADEKDFSEENLERLGITKRYQNTDMEICVEEILRDLDK